MHSQTEGRTWWVAALAIGLCSVGSCGPKATEVVDRPPRTSSACTLPSTMAASNEQTAWQLFVAANCQVNGKLAWTTWTEQTCLEKPGSPGCAPAAAAAAGLRHRLHGSRLGERLRGAAAKPRPQTTPGPCNSMTTTANASPQQAPFVPSNLSKDAEFCEEVFVNGSEAAFVTAPAPGATLTNLTAQVAYAQSQPITFPTTAVEIKADWLPAASVNNEFDCASKPPAGVYTEVIDGKCYALVGMHISSKLLPNWLWATFEPQSTITNPNRCNPDLYNACTDSWGSDPATSTGQSTQATAALTALMSEAGITKQFGNYRLVSAQTAYVDANNNPIQMGNSFVEFNAGVLPHQASCITCHAYAMVSTTAQENPNFGNFPGTPPIGTPGTAPPPPGGGTWVPQDFSWMLGIMPTAPQQLPSGRE